MTPFLAVLIENVLDNRIGRAIEPTFGFRFNSIEGAGGRACDLDMIETNGDGGTRTNISATIFTVTASKLASDLEIR